MVLKTINDLIKEYLSKYPKDEYQINQGASLLLIQKDSIIFTLTKEKKWKSEEDITEIKFSGIGGALETGESIFECLKRETMEEIGINIKNIDFPDLKQTFIIDNDNPIVKNELSIDSEEKIPFYVVRLKLPLREDTIETDKKFSCLQLVVYIAKINSNTDVKVSENEIPGLLFVKKEALYDVLDGKVTMEKNKNNDYVKIKWNENFPQYKIPSTIKLLPQFTPLGLKKINLSFNQINQILEG